jgi:hypothetical protein
MHIKRQSDISTLRSPCPRQRPGPTQLVCAGPVNWGRGDVTSSCPPAPTVKGETFVSPISLELLLIAIPLRLGRPCYYTLDVSSAAGRLTTPPTRQLCPLESAMRDVSSLSIRESQPLHFTWMESRHDPPGDSIDRIIPQGVKPRQIRKRRRVVTVCQYCRHLKKKCDRDLASCSNCRK